MRPALTAILLLLVASLPVQADLVKLRSGGFVEGQVMRESRESVTVEGTWGRVTIPRNRIQSIDYDHESVIEVWNGMWPLYRDQKAPEVFYFLAEWCRSNGLAVKVPMLLKRAEALDPDGKVRRMFKEWKRSDVKLPGENLRTAIPEVNRDEETTAGTGGPGKTELREEVPGQKPERRRRPERVWVAPTWVPPLAVLRESGTIVYPPHAIPGPPHFGIDGMCVPYWGIQPQGLTQSFQAEDLARMLTEYSARGLFRALKTWDVRPRERDVLLIPPNRTDTRHWRLVWSLAPKKRALRIIEKVRSGELRAAE